MVTQEGAPNLVGRATSLDHVLCDAGLSDLKAELEQLAMNARRSPQRIVKAHPPDQRAQVGIELRPASKKRIFSANIGGSRSNASAQASRGGQS
jgi:hypothetical protein